MDPFHAVDHRPWAMPESPWIMRQRWCDLLFAHWPVDPLALRRLVPSDLEVETFDGSAWVGVVPFRMEDVAPRAIPGVPGISAFPELNVRTYVRHGDKPGVWFFSLDAAQSLAVAVARRWFHLPYFRAEMTCDEIEPGMIAYASRRTHRRAPAARLEGTYTPTGERFRARPGTLEHWLTERYCLYAADRRGRLFIGEIHHEPWPLHPAMADLRTNTMATAAGIDLPDTDPHLLFAHEIDVRVWSLRPV